MTQVPRDGYPGDTPPEGMTFDELAGSIAAMSDGTQRALIVAMEALGEIMETGADSSERAERALLDVHAILSETSA
jgi:hypothetical protein